MIQPSTRYATPLALLLLGVVLLVLRQTYFSTPQDDCANPNALYDVAQIEGSEETEEDWSKHRGPRIQWSEGRVPVADPQVPDLRFRILRSHVPRQLYRDPQRYLQEEINVDWTDTQSVAADGESLPVHVVYGHTEQVIQLGAYFFAYAADAVASPYRAQLWAAIPQIFSGGRPLTLFAISGTAPGPSFEVADEAAKRWLVAAWMRYREVCYPQAGAR